MRRRCQRCCHKNTWKRSAQSKRNAWKELERGRGESQRVLMKKITDLGHGAKEKRNMMRYQFDFDCAKMYNVSTSPHSSTHKSPIPNCEGELCKLWKICGVHQNMFEIWLKYDCDSAGRQRAVHLLWFRSLLVLLFITPGVALYHP